MLFPDRFAEIQLDAGSGIPLSIYRFGQDKICFKHFSGTFGIQFLAVDTSFFEQLLCQLFCHWLLQIFQKLIFLPETEAALPVRAVIAGFPIVYFGTAPGTDSDGILRFRRRGKKPQLFGGGGWSGSNQIPNHLRDPGNERICGKCSLLDLEQCIFPVSSHRGGFERDRDDGNKILPFCSWN